MAVRFDAATDRVTWTGTAPTPSSGLTITYWAYVSVDRDDFSTMIRLHSSSGATTNLNVAMDSSGLLPCIFTGGGSSTGPQSVSAGAWARIAVTVTGSDSRVYVALNEAGATQSQDGTVGGNAGVSPDSGYTLGGRSAVDGDEWFNGRLAHVRMWNAVLTQGEVETEWASANPVRTSNLFAAYPLPDAGDLTDHSGNGRHLSAGSTSVSTEDGPPITTTVTGSVAATLPSLDSTSAGDLVVVGAVAATLPAIDAATAGAVAVNGTVAADLPQLVTSTAGDVAVGGAVNTTLPALDMAATATASVDGTVAADLPQLGNQMAGSATIAGLVNSVMPNLVTALHGTVTTPVTGTVAVTLPALTMASATLTWPPSVADHTEPLVAVDGPHQVPWLAVD